MQADYGDKWGHGISSTEVNVPGPFHRCLTDISYTPQDAGELARTSCAVPSPTFPESGHPFQWKVEIETPGQGGCKCYNCAKMVVKNEDKKKPPRAALETQRPFWFWLSLALIWLPPTGAWLPGRLWHFPHLHGNPEPGAHSQAAIQPSDHLGCGAHFLGDERKPALHSGFLPLLSSFLRLQAPHAQEQTGRHQAQQLGACSTAGPCESPGPQLARLSGTQSPSCRFTPSHPLVATLFPNTPPSGLSNRKAHIIKFLFFSRSPKKYPDCETSLAWVNRKEPPSP